MGCARRGVPCGRPIGVGDFTASPTSDGRYVLFTSNAFTVKLSGPHLLTIVGTSAAGSKNSA
ncbi:MAG: hypothetical protein P4L85_17070, partial [Paludisphaera borealis]|uniref:hypothetical protein n=1 Tax=Paludisphaera borealis TaxID=1387353 RepID=UPI00285013D8